MVAIAALSASSLGAGLISVGFSVGPSSIAASSIKASFAGWSSGTKLVSVKAWATSGKAERRVANAAASFGEAASTSMALGVAFGSRIRSRTVATDSTLALFRLIGLKSKLSQ